MLMSDVAKKGAAPEEKRPSNPQGGKGHKKRREKPPRHKYGLPTALWK